MTKHPDKLIIAVMLILLCPSYYTTTASALQIKVTPPSPRDNPSETQFRTASSSDETRSDLFSELTDTPYGFDSSDHSANQVSPPEHIDQAIQLTDGPPLRNSQEQQLAKNSSITPQALDEGSGPYDGGGYPGCGRAPLNRLSGPYIINGQHIKYGEFPQYVQLHIPSYSGQMGVCGGVLVSDREVLTAAHCLKEKNSLKPYHLMRVIFGEDYLDGPDPQEFMRRVRSVCVSTKHTFSNFGYDWGLITLSRPVRFNNYVQPACLPGKRQRILTRGRNSVCFLVASGRTRMIKYPFSHSFVQKMRAENVACYEDFGSIARDRVCYEGLYDSSMHSCFGDSGAPILCLDQWKRWTVMGTVSYGAGDCDGSSSSIYARTRYILDEIRQTCRRDLLRQRPLPIGELTSEQEEKVARERDTSTNISDD